MRLLRQYSQLFKTGDDGTAHGMDRCFRLYFHGAPGRT